MNETLNSPLVFSLEKYVDIEKVRSSTNQILKKYPFNENRQICLTHRPETNDPISKIYEGTGRLLAHSEFDYFQLNEEFADTYLGYLISEIQKKWKIGRTRLALLPPRCCYSMHFDVSPVRFHLAIFTNPFSYITYDSGQMYHIPADGSLYQMNTARRHSAFNGGDTDRVHLVIEIGDKI